VAIVKFGGGVVGLRGAMGGNVFSANTNGAYVRTWANTPNPRTISQFLRRYPFQAWPAAWAALDPQQRIDWNTYGKAHPKTNSLGVTYRATGWQWFVGCNGHLAAWSGSPVYDAPTVPGPVRIDPLSFTYEMGLITPKITINITELSFAGVFAIISAYVIPYGTNTTWPSTYFQMRVDWDPGAGIVDLPFGLTHAIKWGLPQAGWKCFVRVATGDAQGLVSLPWQVSTTYTIP